MALPPFRQAGPPAEGLHHMTAPLSRARVAPRCGAPVGLAISRTALAESLANMRDDKRITSVGSFPGKPKIDELPQQLSVLTGSMSFVSPRPEVPEFVKFYTPDQRGIFLDAPRISISRRACRSRPIWAGPSC